MYAILISQFGYLNCPFIALLNRGLLVNPNGMFHSLKFCWIELKETYQQVRKGQIESLLLYLSYIRFEFDVRFKNSPILITFTNDELFNILNNPKWFLAHTLQTGQQLNLL
jgi:hypothetical protein